jgi:hypothetical protein
MQGKSTEKFSNLKGGLIVTYGGDACKIIPDLPKLLNECAGVRSDSEAGLMGLAADAIERLTARIRQLQAPKRAR